MKHQDGLSLLEMLVALVFFAVLTIAVSGLMVSGLRVRRGSQLEIEAQQAAQSLLEQAKDYWSVLENYRIPTVGASEEDILPLFIRDQNELAANLPESVTAAAFTLGCLESDGTDISDTNAPLFCSEDNPDLRRIGVTLTDASGETYTLSTEIGRPFSDERGAN